MKHLYLMRHGETLFNVQKKIQGWCDSPLTPTGIEQAKKAGELLKAINFDHCYCSTAERCSDTLELVRPNTPYTRLKGIKERGFGSFEGEPEYLNPPGPFYDEIFPKYGGETSKQVFERVNATLTSLLDQDDTDTILAVSHAGACIIFLSTILGTRPPAGFKNCSIAHFTYEKGQFHFVEIMHVAD